MIELAKTGRWLGGTTPTGYKSEQIENISIDGKKRKLFKLSPIDDEVRIVKLIFDKFLELKSQTKLETYMIQNDIKTRNGINFSRWGLKNILTNPVYAKADKDIYDYFKNQNVEVFNDIEDFNGKHGIMAYNKTEQKANKAKKERDISEWIISIGKHHGIVDGATWIKVQELLLSNGDKRYRKPTKNNALLSGLIRCAKCGSYMRPKLKTTYMPNGDLRFDYMCELKEKSRKQKCDCKNVNGNEVDKLVMDEVKKLIEPNSSFRKKLSQLAKNKLNSASKDSIELQALEKTFNKNQTAIENLLDRIKFIDVALIEDITKEIKRLKADNQAIEKRIAEIKDIGSNNINTENQAQIVENIIETYFTTFDELDLSRKRSLLRLLISSVEVNENELEVNLLGVRNEKPQDIVPLCENSK
jgi:site-specific DNA recombinase